MTGCWAASLGGCGEGLSREHLISASLWDGASVDAIGFGWCKTELQRVGPNAVTSRILCRRHNSLLSPLDTAAGEAFDALGRSTALATERSAQPPKVWSTLRFDVNGPLLERWFMKTAVNLSCVHSPRPTWSETGSSLVPPRIVGQIFGLAAVPRPLGLYNAAAESEPVHFVDSVEFAPIFGATGHMVAGVFNFRGPRFVINLTSAALPAAIQLPLGRGREIAASTLLYHLSRMDIRVGHSISHCLDFGWEPPAT